MIDILNNFLLLTLGMVIGFGLGWIFKTMQYAKEARDRTAMLERKLDEHGWYTHKISLLVVLAICIFAAVWTGSVNVNLGKSQTCTEKTVNSIVTVLSERTSLSNKLALADRDQNKAFSHLMVSVLMRPPLTEKRLRHIFNGYITKLNTYLSLQEQQRQTQKANPLPKSIDYRACLKGGSDEKISNP